MKKTIDNPKVFISYAWGTEEYQNAVMGFANKLMGDGVEVILDKWDLSEGNDTFAFMEKCVNDDTITNVLILLDPIYAEKANSHVGGVGTETQIISAKVYKEVNQDKFIPIVFKRDENNDICKPTYLEARLHFDLSQPETFDNEYKRLAQKLYGIDSYPKPEIGKKPQWVDNPTVIQPKTISNYDSLKTEKNDTVRKNKFDSFLAQIGDRFVSFLDNAVPANNDEYLEAYNNTEEFRNEYLMLLKYCDYVDNYGQMIANFFESLFNQADRAVDLAGEIVIIRIHELFIYTIAHFLKNADYSAVGYLLGKTYFREKDQIDNGTHNYNLFFSGGHHSNLDIVIRQRDGKQYHTGTGQYWIETLATDYISKEQFVFADLICYNYSKYGANYRDGWGWFPITYVYDTGVSSCLGGFAKKLISEEKAIVAAKIFGFTDVPSFVKKVKEIEEMPANPSDGFRYPGSFNSAALLGYFISSDKIATLP